MEASNEDINIIQRRKILGITGDLTDRMFQFNPHIQINAAYEIQNRLIVTHNAVDLFEAHLRQMLLYITTKLKNISYTILLA